MDRFDCYELCVQSAPDLAPFLARLHGGRALVLREDFCGSAAVSRRWVRDGASRGEARRAVAVDLDPECVARAIRAAEAQGVGGLVRVVCADAARAQVERGDACDVVFIGNFSIGYIHSRRELVEYFGRCRQRLNEGGILVCDTYDGSAAFVEGGSTRVHVGAGGVVVRATWEKRDADVLTRRVMNVLHFEVERDGEVVERMTGAFEYRWRLWGIAELREAMIEAGFRSSGVHAALADPPVEVRHGRELEEPGTALVVGRR